MSEVPLYHARVLDVRLLDARVLDARLLPELFPAVKQLYGPGSSLPAVHGVREKRESTAK